MISTLQKDGFMKLYSFKNIIYIQANALISDAMKVITNIY